MSSPWLPLLGAWLVHGARGYRISVMYGVGDGGGRMQ